MNVHRKAGRLAPSLRRCRKQLHRRGGGLTRVEREWRELVAIVVDQRDGTGLRGAHRWMAPAAARGGW